MAFALSANYGYLCSEGDKTITLSADITYIRPPKGKKLTATAKCLSRGKRISLYLVAVTDNMGTLVAEVSEKGYVIQ